MPNSLDSVQCLTAGQGALRVSAHAGVSTVVQARASNPLKLLVPQHQGASAWIYTTGFGGGMLSCDHIQMDVRLDQSACAFLGTQASTKIYKRKHPQDQARQDLRFTLDDHATLISLPDPIACFTDADFKQTQDFNLTAHSNLFALDWFSAGRMARGESWHMHQLASRLRYFSDDTLILEDPLVLRAQGPGLRSLRGLAVCGTALIVGEQMQQIISLLQQDIDAHTLNTAGNSFESYSLIPGGLLWRFAARSIDHMYERIYTYVDTLSDLCGDKPWRRRP